MSGDTHNATCPMCGNEEMTETVYTHYDLTGADAFCLLCGYEFFSTEGQMDLAEVNEMREERDLTLLLRLAEQTKPEPPRSRSGETPRAEFLRSLSEADAKFLAGSESADASGDFVAGWGDSPESEGEGTKDAEEQP
jgi:hypothetical protein